MPSVNKKIPGGVCKLTAEQAAELKELLTSGNWEFAETPPPYSEFKAMHERTVVVYYTSGKLVIQGRGSDDFIHFILEPKILHCQDMSKLDGNSLLDQGPISCHGGIDESGKGDFFGPLVVAGAAVTPESGEKLRELGVCDSKAISSSTKIRELAKGIREIIPGQYAVLELMPETYNRLYAKFGNLNRLLAWGHATVIDKLAELVPSCPEMLSDKFANEVILRRALMLKPHGKNIILFQRVRAESDVAVAAASILAREGFLYGMYKVSSEAGMDLPKGASQLVKTTARYLFQKHGFEVFTKCAKLHFKTYAEITGDTAYLKKNNF